MVWIAIGLLTLVSVAALLLPLLRKRGEAVARADYDLAVYKDQLKELDRDIERGLLTASEAEGARLEIQRRLLVTQEAMNASAQPKAALNRPVTAGIVAVLVPLAAAATYVALGEPNMPGQPYAQRQASRLNMSADDAHRVEQMVSQLAARLKENPNDPQGQLMLARSMKAMGRHVEASQAFKTALDLGIKDSGTWSEYGESIAHMNQGMVMPEARQAFLMALSIDPENPRARYYLGLAKAQIGDLKGAVAIWRELEATTPPTATWIGMLRETIQSASRDGGFDPATIPPERPKGQAVANIPAPSGAPQAAPPQAAAPAASVPGVSAAEAKMIGEMVARLEARLQSEPNDPEAWGRLGRSYQVMGRLGEAQMAYERATRLKPKDVDLKLGLAGVLMEQADADETSPPPADAVAVLREVLALEPKNPDALFFVGLSERFAGNIQGAREKWTLLLANLRPDAPNRADIQKQLDSLPKK